MKTPARPSAYKFPSTQELPTWLPTGLHYRKGRAILIRRSGLKVFQEAWGLPAQEPIAALCHDAESANGRSKTRTFALWHMRRGELVISPEGASLIQEYLGIGAFEVVRTMLRDALMDSRSLQTCRVA